MEITIKINGRMVSVEVSAEVAEYIGAGRRKAENLSHEKRRHWDDREFDEYIVAAEGLLPYHIHLDTARNRTGTLNMCSAGLLELMASAGRNQSLFPFPPTAVPKRR